MITPRNIYTAFGLVFSLFLAGCHEGDKTKPDTFDRSDFLVNMADGFVKPAFNQLLTESRSLQSKADLFSENPNAVRLDSLQAAWMSAYSAWQRANGFNFGPAAEAGTQKTLSEEIAIFPVSESKINSILSGNPFNLKDFNRDARGFLAVEYLIFSQTDDDAKIAASFSNSNKKEYLKAICKDIVEKVKPISDAWNGAYRNEFVKNNGTESGSSTSMFYNEFVKSFESMKNFKVGLPLGKRPGQTAVNPNLLEARYSGASHQFLKLNIENINQIWQGKPFNSDVDGNGFKEYLNNVEGGKALVLSSENQMNNVMKVLNDLPWDPNLLVQLESNSSNLDNLHTELQKQTRFFKSDMSSILGIAITYSSGDGD